MVVMMIVNPCDEVNSRRHRQGSWLVDPGHKGSAALEEKGCQVVRESEQKSSSNANHMIIPVPTAGICAPLISRLHSHAQLADICHKGMLIFWKVFGNKNDLLPCTAPVPLKLRLHAQFLSRFSPFSFTLHHNPALSLLNLRHLCI